VPAARYGALFPRLALSLGALAVGAAASFGLQFFHIRDASVTILVWHLGTLAVLAAAAVWYGACP
jgi:hypothetical protein